jgi:NADH:ubiquinone oxidoreductase subunit F (NADH-binding)
LNRPSPPEARSRRNPAAPQDPGQAHIQSFYHLHGEELGEVACQGTACFVARHLNPNRWNAALGQKRRVYCLGKCYGAPSVSSDHARPRIEVADPDGIVLSNVARGGAQTFAAYKSLGGYAALDLALRKSPEEIINSVEKSNLRGRGGAGFPTGRKWRAVAAQSSTEKFVVANADEGDPGAYIDRFLMEDDPHRLIEAMTIAGHAVGATHGYIYLRKEYPGALRSLEAALVEARRERLLGEKILGTSCCMEIQVVVGEGSYVCGEETAMLNSIEGRRPEVRSRPPYPTEFGLYGKPTLVNNIETFASIPWIVSRGGEEYARIGFSKSRGTKVLSLNSLFQRPGLYEVPFGTTVRQVVEDFGGGLKTGKAKGVLLGGPLAGIIPPNLFDTPLGFEELASIGAGVGHGGVIAFDEGTSIIDLLHHVFEFGAFESCGKCTPCRLGGPRMKEIFQRILRSGHASLQDKSECEEIVSCLEMTSLCGHGTGLADFAKSVFRYYSKDLAPCFR